MRIPALAVTLSLLACQPISAHESEGWRGSEPFVVEALNENGVPLPTFQHEGRLYVLGQQGRRYTLRVKNRTGHRVEAVAAVDGRDVIDGKPSALEKRGYIVEAYGETTIDGFRLSDASVAAFRFGAVRDSYAARMGDTRDVGVVGVAIFREREPVWEGPVRGRENEMDDRYQPSDGAPAGGNLKSAPPAAKAPAPPPESRRSSAEAALQEPSKKSRGSSERPGLGTEFGEERASSVFSVNFERQSSQPDTLLTFRYNNREGLAALGIDVGNRWSSVEHERWIRQSAQPFRRDPGYANPPAGWRP